MLTEEMKIIIQSQFNFSKEEGICNLEKMVNCSDELMRPLIEKTINFMRSLSENDFETLKKDIPLKGSYKKNG